jgi:hypothetical protein
MDDIQLDWGSATTTPSESRLTVKIPVLGYLDEPWQRSFDERSHDFNNTASSFPSIAHWTPFVPLRLALARSTRPSFPIAPLQPSSV